MILPSLAASWSCVTEREAQRRKIERDVMNVFILILLWEVNYLSTFRGGLPQMLLEEGQHSFPGVLGSLPVVDFRPGVIKKRVIRVIRDNLNRQIVFLRRLPESLYFLWIDPAILVACDEKHRHLQFLKNVLRRNVSIEGGGRGEFGNLANCSEGKRSAHTE